MPAAEDGEWDNHCSNVVCVRTKSSKEQENGEDVPVISIQPTVVRSVYRSEPSAAAAAAPPPQPPRPAAQRRRITRLIQTTPLLPPTTPTHYEGVSKVSFSLKTPVSSSVGNGPDFGPLPFSPSRRSIAPVRKSYEPPPQRLSLSYDLPESILPPSPGRSLRPISLAPVRRSISVPPPTSAYLRRASVSVVPSYSSTYSSGGITGRQVGNTGSGVTSSLLRRGSVDVSYLSRAPDAYKSISGIRSSVPGSGIRSSYRRGSLSVLGSDRPTYRSSTVGRLIEDDFKPSSLSTTSDAFSSLRRSTQLARDKLDTHRSLIDRYLPGGGSSISSSSRAPSVDSRFVYPTNRNSELESFSRRSSISTIPRGTYTGSRAPSLDRSEVISVPKTPPAPPAVPVMSSARRRIRNVLYKVSGDHDYLD